MEKFTVEKTATVTLTNHQIVTLLIGARLKLKDDVEEYDREFRTTQEMVQLFSDMKKATD